MFICPIMMLQELLDATVARLLTTKIGRPFTYSDFQTAEVVFHNEDTSSSAGNSPKYPLVN
jgi:hypothetical protein